MATPQSEIDRLVDDLFRIALDADEAPTLNDCLWMTLLYIIFQYIVYYSFSLCAFIVRRQLGWLFLGVFGMGLFAKQFYIVRQTMDKKKCRIPVLWRVGIAYVTMALSYLNIPKKSCDQAWTPQQYENAINLQFLLAFLIIEVIACFFTIKDRDSTIVSLNEHNIQLEKVKDQMEAISKDHAIYELQKFFGIREVDQLRSENKSLQHELRTSKARLLTFDNTQQQYEVSYRDRFENSQLAWNIQKQENIQIKKKVQDQADTINALRKKNRELERAIKAERNSEKNTEIEQLQQLSESLSKKYNVTTSALNRSEDALQLIQVELKFQQTCCDNQIKEIRYQKSVANERIMKQENQIKYLTKRTTGMESKIKTQHKTMSQLESILTQYKQTNQMLSKESVNSTELSDDFACAICEENVCKSRSPAPNIHSVPFSLTSAIVKWSALTCVVIASAASVQIVSFVYRKKRVLVQSAVNKSNWKTFFKSSISLF